MSNSRKPKQTEQLPLELDDPRPSWLISKHTKALGRLGLSISRKRLFRTKTTYYVRHEDYDNHEVAIFGPMPDEIDLNDDASDMWSQSGEIDVISETQLHQEFGPDPYINSWEDWLKQGEP